MTALTKDTWRKSSYSGNDANCVEMAIGAAVVRIRDSKSPDADHLTIGRAAFARLVASIQ